MKTVEELTDIFDQIAATTSKNDKVLIITRHSDNSLFKNVLKFVFDDFITTGISTKKIEKKVKLDPKNSFETLEEAMDFVKENNTGKDQTIADLQAFIGQFDEETQQLLKGIFSKNIKVGITSKSINKALGKGFIFEFGCQLAHSYEKYPNKVNGKEFILTKKLDGHRCICFVHEDKVTFFTRKGLEMNGLIHIGEAAQRLVSEYDLPEGEDTVVLDGELLLSDDGSMETKDLFRATSQILKKDSADKSDIQFNIFDWLPLSEFIQGQSSLDYAQRKVVLDKWFYDFEATSKSPIQLVKTLYWGSDMEAISKLQNMADEEGWEGLMLNLAEGFYVTKRTSSLLKLKKFKSADILVLDMYEGEGRNKGRLGGLTCQFKDFKVDIGYGFSDEEREAFWADPSKVVGKIIEIKYFQETTNQNGGKGIRFGGFKTVRHDKTIDDINYED